jgi:predicted HAD superfamily Cof-like phosphohydrolase
MASFAVEALAEFHAHPNSLGEGTNTQALRRTLHEEEHAELMTELDAATAGEGDLKQIARELADVLYISYGTAWAFGIDLDAAFAEVHRAAMDKMRAGLRREDGKILKPPGFRPPDMTEAVRNARLRR